MDDQEIVIAPCRFCLQRTKHHVRHSRNIDETADYGYGEGLEVISTFTYCMIECCGCESISLREHGGYSGDVETNYYPPPVSRPLPKWLYKIAPLHGDLQGVLREIYSALHADNRRLALMGARAVLDMILNEEIGTHGTFQGRLKALKSSGLISTANHDMLEAVLEAGNAAAHRSFQPSGEDMGRVMDIVENILQALYVLGADGEQLRGVTPARPKKNEI